MLILLVKFVNEIQHLPRFCSYFHHVLYRYAVFTIPYAAETYTQNQTTAVMAIWVCSQEFSKNVDGHNVITWIFTFLFVTLFHCQSCWVGNVLCWTFSRRHHNVNLLFVIIKHCLIKQLIDVAICTLSLTVYVMNFNKSTVVFSIVQQHHRRFRQTGWQRHQVSLSWS